MNYYVSVIKNGKKFVPTFDLTSGTYLLKEDKSPIYTLGDIINILLQYPNSEIIISPNVPKKEILCEKCGKINGKDTKIEIKSQYYDVVVVHMILCKYCVDTLI